MCFIFIYLEMHRLFDGVLMREADYKAFSNYRVIDKYNKKPEIHFFVP